MANQLQLDIVTPSRAIYSGPAAEVIVPAWEGQMGLYPQHDALLALLRAGVCSFATPEGTKRFVIGRGFADVSQRTVTLLTDSCQEASSVDKAAAKVALEEGERRYAETLPFTEARAQAEKAIELARALLEA